MSEINTGGPAFPNLLHSHNIERGMTLRDYFAAKALQGIVSRGGLLDIQHVTKTAYQYADAMLKAREQ